jgi:hypothetical protein
MAAATFTVFLKWTFKWLPLALAAAKTSTVNPTIESNSLELIHVNHS